jgi:prefoldin subunit 5
MQDFEKLGVFYLGKAYDPEEGKLLDDLVLYKSKDLTTHAVIIGMTGSGKTGLGIGILEEAAIDRIPVIAIDPKGDLGNMALTFPDLRPEDFRPWINLHEAANKGYTPDDYAAAQAELWKEGLEDWGQSGKRIEKLLDAADITVYTPGSSAGPGVSVLRSFDAPPSRLQEDQDAYRDRVHATATGLLALLGIDADPLTSREHILISGILEHCWMLGQNLGLPELIMAIQTPPMEKVGVMDLESFYPAKDRFALAMRLNSLLASPSFKAWLEGEPLDINSFLYTKDGKPRVSIFSIAHLSDSERMFFVTMLLNEILAWVRTQPGTGSLRAILYMDELFGYLPPTANPPSKTPLLTLLKQARAYGLGLVLATQNPVDLDYKALSNAGTWFIGRLQTERDKARVLAGLEGAAAGGTFDRRRTEQILAGLGKRLFYLHSVYEDEPLIFQTRWVLSYLAGPLTRDQIAALSSSQRPVAPVRKSDDLSLIETPVQTAGVKAPQTKFQEAATVPPVLSPKIRQVYLPPTGRVTGSLVYVPSVIGVADVQYTNAKHGVAASQRHAFLAPLHEGPVALDWKESKPLDPELSDLETSPLEGAIFADYPKSAADPDSYERWKRLFSQFLRTEVPLKLFVSPILKVVSEPGEDERDFRIRLQHLSHERRDEAIEALRKKYASKIATLEDRQRRARQALERKTSQAQQKKLDAAVSTGTALLGVLLGRKSVSSTSLSRVGTAVRSASRARQSGDGISQAEETLQSVEAQLRELESQLQQELERVAETYNPLDQKLEEIEIRATSANITVHLVGLAWRPSARRNY